MTHSLYDHDKWTNLSDLSQPQTRSIGFGPRGAADERLKMVRSWDEFGINYQTLAIRRRQGLWVPEDPDSVIAFTHRNALRSAQVYWVAPGMCELLVTAAATIEVERRLTSDLVSIRRGLCFFASTLSGEGLVRDAGHPVPVDAVHWYPSIRIDNSGQAHHILQIDSYSCMRLPWGNIGMVYSGGSEWKLGHGLTQRSHDHSPDDRDESAFEDRRLLLALWSLMESPGVTDVVEEPMNRATQRRLQREDMPIDAVRVIYLRGSRAQTAEAHSAEASQYHHQWIVSGHWRSQPYGPQRSLRRQVWISPYIKGPTDAPLLTGEKVMALVR